jgi:phage terminase small subunit
MSASEASTERARLNSRQHAFVVGYLSDINRNATQAYVRAGYMARGNAAEVSASKLLRNAKVAAEIERLEANLIQRMRERLGLSLERVLQAIARSALYDPRKLFHPDGRPRDITELDDDTVAAVEGIEVVETYAGSGEGRVLTGRAFKYKLARRSPAQDMLMKHLGGYKADGEDKGSPTANALVSLLSSMRRSALPIAQSVDHDELV